MVHRSIKLSVLLALAACVSSPAPDPTVPVLDPPESSAEFSLSGTPWTETTLVAITGTGTDLMGADGVHIATVGGKLSVCTPWEQGGGITIAALDGSTNSPEIGALPGGEDTKCVDVDHDGDVDAVTASEGSKKIKIYWGPSFSTNTVIAAATNVQKWIQLDFADVTGDGYGDIIGGGKNGVSPYTATWGYFTTTSYRSATAWTYHAVDYVGWTMTLQTIDWDHDGDVDVFLTDRTGGQQLGANKGAWLYEQTSAGQFTAHHLATITGDPSFGAAADLDGDGLTDFVAGNRATITIYTDDGNSGYNLSSNLKPSGTGDFHGVALCDVDGDDVLDLLTTYALTAVGDTWVAWVDQSGNATEVAGAADVQRKPDQPACVDADGDGDPDAVVSEGGDGVKTDDKGVVLYTNPRVP